MPVAVHSQALNAQALHSQASRALLRAACGGALLVVLATAATLLSDATRFPVTPVSVWVGVAGGLSTLAWLAAAALVLLLAMAIVRSVVARARARHDPDAPQQVVEPPPMSAPAKLLVAVILLSIPGAVVAAVVMLSRTHLLAPSGLHAVTPSSATTTAASAAASAPAQIPGGTPSGHLGVWGAVGAVVLVACLMAVTIARRRRHARRPGGTRLDPKTERASLVHAVSAGSAAMTPLDPRAAILACYRAMEAALADDGLVRHDAETPNDLLARASREHLVPSVPAGELCRLFDEARFSDHPLNGNQRDRAIRSLEQVRSGLTVRS